MAQRIVDNDGDIVAVNTDGSINVLATAAGGVASGSADSGNPVKIAGVYRSTKPTLVDGNRGDVQLDTRGKLLVALGNADSLSVAEVIGTTDALTAANSALRVISHAYGYNGATFDRLRTAGVYKFFASTAITAGTGVTVWTPTSGKKFRLMGWLISSSVAGQLIFGDNLVGTVFMRGEAVAAAGVSRAGSGDLGNGFLSAAANNVLKLDGPTGNVAGMVWGVEE